MSMTRKEANNHIESYAYAERFRPFTGLEKELVRQCKRVVALEAALRTIQVEPVWRDEDVPRLRKYAESGIRKADSYKLKMSQNTTISEK